MGTGALPPAIDPEQRRLADLARRQAAFNKLRDTPAARDVRANTIAFKQRQLTEPPPIHIDLNKDSQEDMAWDHYHATRGYSV